MYFMANLSPFELGNYNEDIKKKDESFDDKRRRNSLNEPLAGLYKLNNPLFGSSTALVDVFKFRGNV